MEHSSSLRKNPSRETCEKIIRKILTTEVLQQGCNMHFKQATDFMNYFESLYPASDSLTKQVQRAVKMMQLPKDENGCYIINKTKQQVEQDDLLKKVFQDASCEVITMVDITPVFLSVKPSMRSYILDLISNSVTLMDKYLTIAETSNGLIIYTNNPVTLCKSLENYCNFS